MKKKRDTMVSRFFVMLFILLFAGQHSVICWSASSFQSSGESRTSVEGRHTDAAGAHTDATSMETDCTQPCHLTPMKTPRLALNTSYSPGINKALQEAFSKEEVIASVFHPPRFVSSSST